MNPRGGAGQQWGGCLKTTQSSHKCECKRWAPFIQQTSRKPTAKQHLQNSPTGQVGKRARRAWPLSVQDPPQMGLYPRFYRTGNKPSLKLAQPQSASPSVDIQISESTSKPNKPVDPPRPRPASFTTALGKNRRPKLRLQPTR